MNKDLFLGIDIGSVSVKTALLDSRKSLLAETCTRIKGDPVKTLRDELTALLPRFPDGRIAACGITGSGGKQLAVPLGSLFVNEILAQAAFAGAFHPEARTIIEMGGEDAKLISLGQEPGGGVKIEDFSMNTACAAGTGSFLDQQATRLNLSIEEFGAIALKSKTPPAVAGRCSVFAKSDMIHLQQIATPDFDIVAGLCFAMARNFKATVGRARIHRARVPGRRCRESGCRAFQEVLKLADGAMTIPGHFAHPAPSAQRSWSRAPVEGSALPQPRRTHDLAGGGADGGERRQRSPHPACVHHGEPGPGRGAGR
jgi:activator of 2-hydroxyglutaryl-CoA dehydratase